MTQNIFYPLLRDIQDHKEAIQLHLSQGGARTQEDYWRTVGAYTTLETVEDMVKSLEQRYIAD